MKRVLIVGAGGFIGGFIAKRALELGYDTTVGVRSTTSRRYLTDDRLRVLEFDYDDAGAVRATLDSVAEPWDYVIYNLGATKAAHFPDFNRINFQYLRTFATALKECGKMPQKFLYMSSLSAIGPGDEKNYTPISETDYPRPSTRYGLSKVKAEQWLETQSGLPWIIFRATGVYGPHEQDYLMMIKSIDRHFDFGVGYRKQLLTFIYVEDLVEAMFMALDKAPTGHRYNISEPRSYSQAEFRKIVADQLGRKFVIPMHMPLWAVKGVSYVAQKIGLFTGKPSTLNLDKYKIMKQRNWQCTTAAATADFGFTAPTSLAAGIAKTIASYRNDQN
ncbi:MAG: NAD(P)-dependent oxidoreductase [Bacteroides sp.]|nr:NAD(P)-dependent oxidoreductase [Bacteroides sp.]MCM1378639.1 NAD(P)-dependent oxidoreductase [Bacteroides sp.]MCM1446387.1 NAD(P)-dependent oxidoreductase [Prevotella sp.]